MANPNARARVQWKYEAQYRDPIQAKAGESVEVGRADNDDPGSGVVPWIAAKDAYPSNCFPGRESGRSCGKLLGEGKAGGGHCRVSKRGRTGKDNAET